MARRAAAALVAAVLLAACSGGGSSSGSGSSATPGSTGSSSEVLTPGPPASVAPGDPNKSIAAVNGTTVSEASFNAELNAVGLVPSFLDATDLALAPGNIATRLPGGGFDPGYVRSLLRRRVLITLAEGELRSRGVAVDPVCTQVATDRLPGVFTGDPEEGRAFLAAFPPAYVQQLVTWNAEIKQLQAVLSGLPCDTTAPDAQSTIGTAYGTWLDAALGTAVITIDPAYGTWDTSTGTIDPPGGVGVTTTAPAPPTTGGSGG